MLSCWSLCTGRLGPGSRLGGSTSPGLPDRLWITHSADLRTSGHHFRAALAPGKRLPNTSKALTRIHLRTLQIKQVAQATHNMYLLLRQSDAGIMRNDQSSGKLYPMMIYATLRNNVSSPSFARSPRLYNEPSRNPRQNNKTLTSKLQDKPRP